MNSTSTDTDVITSITNMSSTIADIVVPMLDNMTFVNDTNSTGNGTSYAKTVVERSWLYFVPGPVFCGFGIVCNILNLCVLLQKDLHESPYTYLTALATADLSFLVTAFGHLVTSKAKQTASKAFFDAYIFFGFGNICFNASVWITVVMTVERMLFVIKPLTMRPSRKKANITLCVIFVFCCIINIPRFFCYTILKYRGLYYPYGTEFRESQMFFRFSWFHAVIINFIPLIILITTNIVLIYTLQKAGRQRVSLRTNNEESSRRDQTRLTRTLVAIVVLFFVCTTPSAFVEDPIAYSLFGGNMSWSQFLKSTGNQTFIYISNLLLFLNSSLNFVLYCAFNQRFRRAMHSFFGKLDLRKRRTDTMRTRSHTTTTTYVSQGFSPSPCLSKKDHIAGRRAP